MTHLYRQLRRLDAIGQPIRVGVIGCGFMGRGLVHQLARMKGVRPALVVSRNVERAAEAYRVVGFNAAEITVSNHARVLSEAILRGKPTITMELDAAAAARAVDVVIEATGAVEYGAKAALAFIRHRKPFVSFNAETDATVGCLLKKRADRLGVVYSNGDGDQPGVLMRLVEYCRGCGFEVRAAVNCKGHMDVRATPQLVMPWARKQNTSPRMTSAFADGTKMNLEQNVLCNAAGLVPLRRGMRGVRTELRHVLRDFEQAGALGERGCVEYTLGGDFGGGVLVIARAEDPQAVGPYLKYLKMGEGPDYVFYRPYHLCHIETPLSAAEAVIYREPTIAPLGRPVAHTVAVAKRKLRAGEMLGGIGGQTVYGQIDTAENCRGLLPVGLAEDVRVTRDVGEDEPIEMEAVELDESRLIVQLWKEQEAWAWPEWKRSEHDDTAGISSAPAARGGDPAERETVSRLS